MATRKCKITYVTCVIFLLDSSGLEPVSFQVNSLMVKTQVHRGILTQSYGKSKKVELDKRRRRK